MFNVNVSQLGSVVVKTSERGGLNNEQIADLAVEKIASVSEDAPPHLKEQAKLFKEQLKGIIHHYILLARKEERATIMQALRSSGHKEMAEYIRRL
jgi:hypothetical protein